MGKGNNRFVSVRYYKLVVAAGETWDDRMGEQRFDRSTAGGLSGVLTSRFLL